MSTTHPSKRILVASPDIGDEEKEMLIKAVKELLISGISPCVKEFENVFSSWLREYHKVICVSHKLRDEVRDVLGIDCDVIPLPMKLELFKPENFEEQDSTIVHVGSRPVKNPQIGIEALKVLRKRGYETKLVIVGPPTELATTEGVEYRFRVPEKEKIELVCRAKALILPSGYEALPYVVLEAMACGTPVVVSRVVPEPVPYPTVLKDYEEVATEHHNKVLKPQAHNIPEPDPKLII